MDIKKWYIEERDRARKIVTLEKNDPVLNGLRPWVNYGLYPFFIIFLLIAILTNFNEILNGFFFAFAMGIWLGVGLVYSRLLRIVIIEAENDGFLDRRLTEA